jgi:hypothetical protein
MFFRKAIDKGQLRCSRMRAIFFYLEESLMPWDGIKGRPCTFPDFPHAIMDWQTILWLQYRRRFFGYSIGVGLMFFKL